MMLLGMLLHLLMFPINRVPLKYQKNMKLTNTLKLHLLMFPINRVP